MSWPIGDAANSPSDPLGNYQCWASESWANASRFRCSRGYGIHGLPGQCTIHALPNQYWFIPSILNVARTPTSSYQIGKILGAKVIGIAGAEDKCKWLVEELGIDAAYNYKDKDWKAKFRKEVGYL